MIETVKIVLVCIQLILLPIAGYCIWKANKFRKQANALREESKKQTAKLLAESDALSNKMRIWLEEWKQFYK